MPDVLEELKKEIDPELLAYTERAPKENPVDLYVEYYNRAVDVKCQKGRDSQEAKLLDQIVRQCEMRIISQALTERGWESEMIFRFRKKNK